MKKLLLIITVLCFANTTFSQSLSDCLKLAGEEINSGQWEHAEQRIQRGLFFTEDSLIQLKAEFLELSAKIHEHQHNWEKAYANRLEALHIKDLSDSTFFTQTLINQLQYKQCLIYMAHDHPELALYYLQKINSSIEEKTALRTYGLTEALLEIMNEDFVAGEHLCLQLSRNKEDSLKIKQLMSAIEKQYIRYNPKKAKGLSRILPGLGQAYAGNYKTAINSFILVGGIVSAGVIFAINYTIIDAILFTAPFFQRYYNGGVKRAEQQTADRKKTALNKTIQELYSQLR